MVPFISQLSAKSVALNGLCDQIQILSKMSKLAVIEDVFVTQRF